MKEIFVVTGTVTYAMRAKEILAKNGFSADVKKWNDRSGKYGCGYGVKLRKTDTDVIKELLLKNGVKIIDIIVKEV